MSAEEKNKALARKFFEEAWGKGNLAAVEEFIAAEYVMHPIPSGLPPGPEGTKQAITTYRTAFPDLQATVDDIFAAGDRVALRWSFRGTHLGDWLGIPPTGNHMAATGISVYRMAGGKVVENWTSIDLSPTEEEKRWLTEGGGWPRRSPDIPATERDTSQIPIWDVLTRNLTWRFRVAEAQERERIEQELQVSRRIQQASLPEEVPKLERWQINPYYQPAREVGADFYDFHLLSEGRLGVVVGDATGKGVPAALVMSTTCGMLRLAAQSYTSPGEMLQRVNEALFPYIPPNMFVTCFYAVLDPESGLLRYANAGHDLPYLHHDGDAKELRARGMPLGLMSSMGYEEMELVLEASESVLFYSDGLVEAHDPEGEMFGFPRLRALVAEHAEERSLVHLQDRFWAMSCSAAYESAERTTRSLVIAHKASLSITQKVS
ncbi:MAG TPA: SpoIIE family protein phosphatase [Rubrobacter sp.]|nr:SpoIIE family protein phosphatase [Rubrobacter sp.]